MASSVEVTQTGSGDMTEATAVLPGSSDCPTTFLLGLEQREGAGGVQQLQSTSTIDS